MLAAGADRPAFDLGEIAVSARLGGTFSFLRSGATERWESDTVTPYQPRLAAEGVRSWSVDDGEGRVEASAELGLRYDGGSVAADGFGVETAAELSFALPTGLEGWIRGRHLLAPASSGLEERGVGAGLRRDERPDRPIVGLEDREVDAGEGRVDHGCRPASRTVGRQQLEAGLLLQERQLDSPGGPVALLADDDLRHAGVLGRLLVHLLAEDEHDDVRVLLQRA